ncbi:syntaxin-binding protein 3 [Cricetulus griseus]|uniref:Syntaxin-binding protein 3 n=1 Tax=Cricetulus griseus TaxID=10029 RepID=A0A061IQS0_CRIGR|nr:syntaxin-binding protein 3 [Cricetulus griseus]
MAPPVTERGLKSVVWRKIKTAVFDDCRKEGEWKIMLLDEFTTKLLSSCCKMTDLLEEGITVIENIYKNREPVRQMKALYFISPTSKSVDCFLRDFGSKRENKYKAAYIYFTDYAFYYCYSPDPSNASRKEAVMEAMAEQIVTVCATLDENPGVRYKRHQNHSTAATENRHNFMIFMVIDVILRKDITFRTSLSALTQLMKKMPHFRKQMTKRIQVQIPVSTWWLTVVCNSSSTGSNALFWPLGTKHTCNCHTDTHQVVHLNLAEDCMNKFKLNIEKLCKTEQDLALGTDAEGQRVKDSMLVLLPVLLNKNHDNCDKIRAVLLYIFGINGTTEENLDRLIHNVKIEDDSDMIRNWSHLGVPIVPPSQQAKPVRKDRSAEETFQLSRWTPFIKDIMEDAIDNRLDSKEWPYCSRCPAVWNGSGAVSARQKPRANYLELDRKNGSRLIIFVIGGITYSEMRCAYEVSQAHKSCEVIIGSTHILTPRKLLDDIKMLNKSKDKVSFLKEEYRTDGKDKEAVLEEDDDLWVRVRHRHIALVLEEIPKLMKEISSTKKATEGKITLTNTSPDNQF